MRIEKTKARGRKTEGHTTYGIEPPRTEVGLARSAGSVRSAAGLAASLRADSTTALGLEKAPDNLTGLWVMQDKYKKIHQVRKEKKKKNKGTRMN